MVVAATIVTGIRSLRGEVALTAMPGAVKDPDAWKDTQTPGKLFSCHPIEVDDTGPEDGGDASAGAVQLG